jgi:hypothetical protein
LQKVVGDDWMALVQKLGLMIADKAGRNFNASEASDGIQWKLCGSSKNCEKLQINGSDQVNGDGIRALDLDCRAIERMFAQVIVARDIHLC